MSRPLWFVTILKKVFPLRFLGAKMTQWPLVGSIMQSWLYSDHKNGDTLFYLPNDRVIVNQAIASTESTVVPSEVVKHFIEHAQHHFIMNECICRAANDCKDFPHDFGCLFLGDGVLDINPKLGRLVSKGEALNHARRCEELGLVHLVGRDKIDAIWMGVTPSTKLMTVCSCCSCCCLFKFIPELAPKLQDKIHAMPGVNVIVTDACVGCGTCTEDICFINAITVEKGKAEISQVCKGCGRCVSICPQQAIQLLLPDSNFVEATINQLSESIDIHS